MCNKRGRPVRRSAPADERGMVSAEMALWSIIGAMMAGLVLWGCLQGAIYVRCSEAASQAARLDARGDTAAVAELESRFGDLRFAREVRAGLARVIVSGTGPSWGFLGGFSARVEAVVDIEADE